jgi:hypothetical protein
MTIAMKLQNEQSSAELLRWTLFTLHAPYDCHHTLWDHTCTTRHGYHFSVQKASIHHRKVIQVQQQRRLSSAYFSAQRSRMKKTVHANQMLATLLS